jgi:hypothetical protein
MDGKCVNQLKVGCRVWAEFGLHEHGHNKANVPLKTGGMVVSARQEFQTIDQLLYTVKWDSGQDSVHYYESLCAIGSARDLNEFEGMIMAEAIRVEKVVGPNGGLRSAKIILRNGDWISGLYGLESRLEASNIPIQVERLERRRRSV